MKIADWMTQSGDMFGMSGACGLIVAMTDAVCLTYTFGDIKHLEALGEFKAGTSVAVAEDLSAGLDVLRLSDACAAVKYVDETDGLRLTFKNGDIVHLWPSGNAPELRVYVEASARGRDEELPKLGMDDISLWQQ